VVLDRDKVIDYIFLAVNDTYESVTGLKDISGKNALLTKAILPSLFTKIKALGADSTMS